MFRLAFVCLAVLAIVEARNGRFLATETTITTTSYTTTVTSTTTSTPSCYSTAATATACRRRRSLKAFNPIIEESEIAVELQFDSLDDFKPDSVANQVPEINKLIENNKNINL